jgi:O-antigen/teichoic acid export membrane protein
VISGTGTIATIALDIVLIPSSGISGAGLGWLGGQLLAAAVALGLMTRVARHPDLLPVPPPGAADVVEHG